MSPIRSNNNLIQASYQLDDEMGVQYYPLAVNDTRGKGQTNGDFAIIPTTMWSFQGNNERHSFCLIFPLLLSRFN